MAVSPPSIRSDSIGSFLTVDQDDENDSTLGDDLTTMSESVRSSIYDFVYENGRRYHASRGSDYLLPNDETEQGRLDISHHIYLLALQGRLYTSPIDTKSPLRVLDIGTGTGIWAIDLADELPNAEIVGTDISPIQPAWIPPNCQFYIEDAEGEWSFEEPFDFVHGRVLCGGIADWPTFYARAFQNIKPGGWMEMQEHECDIRSDDDTINQAHAIRDWVQKVDQASTMIGKRLNVAHTHRQHMIDAGFIDVHEDIHKLPIGTWPKDKRLKEIGRWE